MPLVPGTKLGAYEVISPIGAGGMGEVYRARDTRLDRIVAVKVLADDIACDPRALARFQMETKAVAALSHPNIMAIHDVGDANGIHFAVTELLEGETLRAVIHRGPLPVRRALEIAGQLADALAAAHDKGIIHRDVKPENAFITLDGRVKILDFGLARQRTFPSSPGDTQSPTVAGVNVTDAGSILGTVAYMSPEQAQGLPVDHRSDQFSLGIVLYEMLTGRRPFQRESAPETLVAIIREEPEPVEASLHVPAPVRWLVERLLAKDPKDRYDTTRDLARELRTWSLHASETGLSSGSEKAIGPGKRSWWRLPAAVATALVCAGVLAGSVMTAFLKGTARNQSQVTRLEIRLPEGYFLSQHRQPFTLSPDGRLVVFSAFTWKKAFDEQNAPQLFLRPLDSFEARPIPGTEGGIQPAFSPDGRHVAFTVVSEKGTFLKRVPVAGGQVTTICQCEALFGITWSPDGSILFASEMGPLKKVPDTGGTPEPATTLDAAENETTHRLPHLLPGGDTVLYTVRSWGSSRSWKQARIYAQHIGDNERHLLVKDGSDGHWVAPGNLVFAREGRLFAAPLDVKALRLSGKDVPILEGVSHSIWTGSSHSETGTAMVDFVEDRVFGWIPGSVDPERKRVLVWLEASGKETPVELPKGPILSGRVSPGGEQILVAYNYPGKQVEVLDVERGARRNVTFEMEPLWAIWGPGPDRVTFISDHEGPVRIYSRKIDAGPQDTKMLWKGAQGGSTGLGSWSRDGKTLAFTVFGEKGHHDIWLLTAGQEPRPFIASRFYEAQPDISPDGRWLVYTSGEPGRAEIFVKPLETEGPARQVSAGGGIAPLWTRDGSAILFWVSPLQSPDQGIYRVRVKAAGKELLFSKPERVLEARYLHASPGRGWDVAPDGRFLIVKGPDETDRRAYYEKALSDRIRIDMGGLTGMLAEAGKAP